MANSYKAKQSQDRTKKREEKMAEGLDRMYVEKKKMWWSIISHSLGSIILFGALGYGLDQWLGTEPGLLITFLILSFPFTQYTLYKRVQKMTQN